MTEKKGPVIVGNIDTSSDPVVQYEQGIAERMAKNRAERPKIGNLAQANESYKPGKDVPMTIEQIAEANRRAESGGGSGGGGLSQKTVDGMIKIAQATQASRQARLDHGQAPSPSPKETRMSEAQPEEKRSDPEKSEKEKKRVSEAVENMDDLEFERIMRGIQNDVINNQKEKEHVNNPENKRLGEIDFAAGIASGEFEQWVDVVPGRLRVHYRTVTAMENQAIRLWIFNKTEADPRLERISGEMYGLGLTVASVVQIGGTKEPDHLQRNGQGTYNAVFDDDAFAKKYDKFARMPNPLLHAIGVHGEWFDLRVRQLFTTDYAKNG